MKSWKVTYRDKNGTRAVENFMTENREALFKLMSDKGLSVIRIDDVTLQSKRPSWLKATPLQTVCLVSLISALSVGAALVTVWMLLRPSEASKQTGGNEAIKRTPSVQPVQSTFHSHSDNKRGSEETLPKDKRRDIKGNIISVPKNPWGQPIPPELEYKPIWEYTTEDYAKIDPGYVERHKAHRARQEAIPWKTDADRQLAILLFAKDGNTGLLTPFNSRFKDQFLKSIETPIIPSKDDTPELQEQKRQMNEVKIWLKERMDDGEDIVDILNSEYKNAQKIRTLRNNLQEELRNVEKTAQSVQEVQDFIDAANKMLDEYGASHVGLPLTLTRLRLEREASKQQ